MSHIINSVLAITGAVSNSSAYQDGWPTGVEAGGHLDASIYIPRGGCFNQVYDAGRWIFIHDTLLRDGWYKSS